jgi:heme exporter protein D
MSRDACPRCGLESGCSRGGWPDRHPVAAVIGGLLTLVWMSMMFSVYPVAALIMTALAAGAWAVRAAGRERARRDALAARADYEHRALMRAMPWNLSPIEPAPQLPPPPVRRRPADHRSVTEPLRMVR